MPLDSVVRRRKVAPCRSSAPPSSSGTRSPSSRGTRGLARTRRCVRERGRQGSSLLRAATQCMPGPSFCLELAAQVLPMGARPVGQFLRPSMVSTLGPTPPTAKAEQRTSSQLVYHLMLPRMPKDSRWLTPAARRLRFVTRCPSAPEGAPARFVMENALPGATKSALPRVAVPFSAIATSPAPCVGRRRWPIARGASGASRTAGV